MECCSLFSPHETIAEINDATDVFTLNVCLENKHILCANIKEHSTHLRKTIDIKKKTPYFNVFMYVEPFAQALQELSFNLYYIH